MESDFLVIGHITHDRAPEGFRLGGTVTFAAVTAKRLGKRPAVLTSGSLDGVEHEAVPDAFPGTYRLYGGDLDGIVVHLLPSPVTTTFSNTYRGGQRTQIIESVANPILPEQLPPNWRRLPIVLLGPVAQEMPTDWVHRFPESLLGVTPQGWMRRWDETGRVYPTLWENAGEVLPRADAVVLSREDVGGDEAYIVELAQQSRLLVVTDGYHGATVYQGHNSDYVPVRPVQEVDPTGAGDVFATAFLIHLHETGDPLAATRFAHIVASMSVEAAGLAGIPERRRVEARLAA